MYHLIVASLKTFRTGKVANPPLEQAIRLAIEEVPKANPDDLAVDKLAFWLAGVIHHGVGHSVVLARYCTTRFLYRICKAPDRVQMAMWSIIILLSLLHDDFEHVKSVVRAEHAHCLQFMVTSSAFPNTPRRSDSGLSSLYESLPPPSAHVTRKKREVPPVFAQPLGCGLRPLPSMFVQASEDLGNVQDLDAPPSPCRVASEALVVHSSALTPSLRPLLGMFRANLDKSQVVWYRKRFGIS